MNLASGSAASVPPLVVGYRSGRLRVGLGLAVGDLLAIVPLWGWVHQVDLGLAPAVDYTLHAFAGGRGALYADAACGLQFGALFSAIVAQLGAGARLRLVPGVAAGVEGGPAIVDTDADGNMSLLSGVFGAVTLTLSFPVGPSR